jgi:hypothetical protein
MVAGGRRSRRDLKKFENTEEREQISIGTFSHQEGRKHHIIIKTIKNFDHPASVFLFPISQFIFSLPLFFNKARKAMDYVRNHRTQILISSNRRTSN